MCGALLNVHNQDFDQFSPFLMFSMLQLGIQNNQTKFFVSVVELLARHIAHILCLLLISGFSILTKRGV